MKKLLHNTLIIGALAFSVKAAAQPILTAANMNPMIGDIFVTKTSAAVSPGSAGASQTWNLSAMTSSATSNYTAVTAASTPSGSAFPTSNVCLSNGASYLYLVTTSGLQQTKGIVGGGVLFNYSNPENLLTYPFNYTNSFVDPWATTFVNSSITFYRTGTSTVTADGYGTVTTPAGTFSNAMRIHLYQVYKDSANPGFPILINYINDEYVWYLPGNHYAVASTFTLMTGSTPSTGGSYLNNVITGISEQNAALANSTLFPNPASQQISVNFKSESYQTGEMHIYDALGQSIKTMTGVEAQSGNNTLIVNTNDLSPGIYYLNMQFEGVLNKNERFVITR